MEAKIKSINSVKLISPEEALEAMLRTVNSGEVRAELLKWLDFGADPKNTTLSSLSTEQLILFMDKLPDLILVLYTRQKELQKGGDR
ncbi:hypothetical protein [Mucilaginibacter sp.]